MQAVAQRLREQAEWFRLQSPGLELPHNLQGLPSEEEACEGEGAEIANLQQRWENDVVQLQALLLDGQMPLQQPKQREDISRSPSPPGETSEEAQQRIQELEAVVKKQKRDTEKLAQEVQRLRKKEAAGEGSAAAAPPPVDNSQELETLRKELDASEEKVKDQTKKLKQLATAYKKVDQEKKETEQALAAAKTEAAKPREPERKALPPGLLTKVRSALADSKAQLNALKLEVRGDFQQQLPVALDQALQQKMPELQEMMESGAKAWKEKYVVECDKRRKLHNLVQELKGNIRVFIRVRPLNARESGSCISFPGDGEITIRNEESGSKKTWSFNEVLRENSSQADLFAGVRDLVVSMMDGYNVCIFAYGQTGAGKTHSMQGTPAEPGIYMRTFKELFKVAAERIGWTITLKLALVEIYNDEIRDLLAEKGARKEKLQVKQGKEGNYVPGLTMRDVNSPEAVDETLVAGSANRAMAATDMNEQSSRSHLLVQIYGTITPPEGKTKTSLITLVDLAGSERIAKSGVTGDRAKEAIGINKSLTALGSVINARAAKSGHTPFRDSTLTHLLQDSLSGDAKTLMLLQINPCKDHVEESLCSLQFGARVNNVEIKK